MIFPNTFFIIGVNGVGKSSLIPFLRSSLGSEFVIHDFDERGVPDNAGKDWRISETLHWMQAGKENTSHNVSTIICGFSKPQEIVSAASKLYMNPKVCLLDASEETLSQRILSRYTTPESILELQRTTGKTPEKFVMDNIYISSQFRKESEENGFFILKTDNLSPEQVAEKIRDWIIK
jgi:predicted ATPase